MATFRAPVTQARPAACLIRDVVLEVALGGGPPTDGAGAGGVPDLGQVPQPGPGVVAPALEPMVTRVGGQRVQGDDQVGPGSGGAQPPGPPGGRRLEREPRPVSRAGAGAFPAGPGFGPGAAVGDGVPLLVGDGQAPGGLRVVRGGGGQVAGQPGSAGPRPDSSPGRPARRVKVASGAVRVTRLANPAGIAPGPCVALPSWRGAGSPGPGAGRGRRGRAARPCRPPARRPSVPGPGR